MLMLMEVLKENGIAELRPPQKKVVEGGLLNKNKNFLICIPTASGKTLIGEMAFINHLLDNNKTPTNKKGLFIVPLKALANEKYEEFKGKYEKYGLKIALSIGDFDEKEDLKGYDLIITTAEKLDSLIRHKVEWIKDISVVVIDEIHLIGDESRGGTLEVLLTKLKTKKTIQIIGLSATIGNPEELAKWLNAELIVDEWRPVKLKKGIGYGNKIMFIDDNGNTINEVIVDEISKNNMFNLVVDSILKDGSCIIFCNSKRGAVGEAKKLNLKKYLSPDEISELRHLKEEVLSVLDNPTKTCKDLAECIEKGVAFHHAGLTYEQRKIVEEGFRKKLIKAICCTPTLSAGINMPCRRAIIRDLKRFSSRGYIPIPKMEIHQCIGRAGRPNLDPYGEGIIYINNTENPELIENAKNYLIGNVEEIYSKLSNQKVLRTHMLGLITTGDIKNKNDLEEFIKNTFYAYQYQNTKKILENIYEITNFLEKNGFIELNYRRDENKDKSNNSHNNKKNISNTNNSIKMLVLDNNNSLTIKSRHEEDVYYNITPLGKKVSELYIDPLSAEYIIDGLKNLHKKTLSNPKNMECYILHILYIISKTTEMQPVLRVRRKEENDLINDMIKLDIDVDDVIYGISSENLEYFKNAKLFYDWINEIPEEELLLGYNIEPGILRYNVEQAKWMIHSAKEIFNLLNIDNKVIKDCLNDLEIRMEYGAKQDIIELLKIKHIGRARARILYNAGIKNANDIINNQKNIINLLGEKIARKILSELGVDTKFGQMRLSI
ncbi:DEAD/DEAH box helicase [Methanothermococcus okinawensis]|uniref:ATP-dependent DNA helicase Hel308 n=1 Tax=Methanothermococcus okinawensis (strain DSM 14208 / JCM 11175 / IH1) TaxID=647113 RepID=F8AJR7_METOI|nr:DEAD/DEAH box helicase [Methanothermococcus okinawensis]AEH07265.1 ski2-type helicase [Methanothermococcus okinawensis IH1]